MGHEDSSGTAPEAQNVFRHSLGTHHDKALARVDLSGDVGIEYGKKLIEVAGGTRRDEFSGEHLMFCRFDGSAGVGGLGDLASGPAGQLPARR